ncbi:MAG: DoxX family protein [bacterium]
MKKTKLLFWIPTIIIFFAEGIVPVLTGHTEFAKESIRHLGYPEYFGTMFIFFKAAGALALILPKFSPRVKEWAYAGFAIDFICAFISTVVVDGLVATAILPLVFIGLLMLSYVYYHKMRGNRVTF